MPALQSACCQAQACVWLLLTFGPQMKREHLSHDGFLLELKRMLERSKENKTGSVLIGMKSRESPRSARGLVV